MKCRNLWFSIKRKWTIWKNSQISWKKGCQYKGVNMIKSDNIYIYIYILYKYIYVLYIYIYIFTYIYIHSYDWIEITIQVTCYCQSSYESLSQEFWDHLWFLSYGNSVRVEDFKLHHISILYSTANQFYAWSLHIDHYHYQQYLLTSLAGLFRSWLGGLELGYAIKLLSW